MTTFTKLDNTNCVAGRITGGPGSNGNDYKYLGDFNSYEECAKSPNIPENAKAITYHNDKNIDFAAWEKQCFSINDTNTQVPNQDYATCGIIAPNSPKQTAASIKAPTVPTVMTDEADATDADDALVNQISNLQKLETEKYTTLDILLKSNPSPDNIAQQKTIISDITEIATVRSKLFDTMLNNASNNLKVNEQMNSNLETKKTVVTLKENALSEQRANLQASATTIDDSNRMIGINTYYDKQYAARVKIMKFIVIICFIIIFLIVLLHLGWLPQEFVTVLVVVTLFGGLIYAGSLIYDMYQRNNLNFDEYDFPIDSDLASKISQSTAPRSTASSSTDRSCSSSLYSSIASTAADVEDSISSKATLLKNELTGTPDPSKSSSSLSASANAGVSTSTNADGTTLPSVQSKLSESFLPLMSRMDKRQFNSNDAQQPMAYDSENNYGKI
jgi:hypothetical protein